VTARNYLRSNMVLFLCVLSSFDDAELIGDWWKAVRAPIAARAQQPAMPVIGFSTPARRRPASILWRPFARA
jgi:hypothetical protein